MPVLPAVLSTTSPPGLISPRFSASRIIWRAGRSFTDWPGFMNSALPRMVHPVAAEVRSSLISGVLPMASTIPSLVCIAAVRVKKRSEPRSPGCIRQAQLFEETRSPYRDSRRRGVYAAHELLDILARYRADLEPGFFGIGEEAHVVHRLHERAAQRVGAIRRNTGR